MRIDICITKNIRKILEDISFFTQEEKTFIYSLPRMFWQKEIKLGNILFEKKKIKPGFQIEEVGDIFFKWKNIKRDLNLIYTPKTLAYPFPIEIKYSDKNILAINKPAGVSMHPVYPLKSKRKVSLADALLAYFPNIKNVGEKKERPGIVHRLDKGTSGIVIAAKNNKTYAHLKSQFKKRKVQKTYLALVRGNFPYKYFQMSGFLGKNTKNPTLRSTSNFKISKLSNIDLDSISKKILKPGKTNLINPKWSCTIGEKVLSGNWDELIKNTSGEKPILKHWHKLLKKDETFSLLKLYPITGRTHQIRMHLKEAGFPIVGDRVYGEKSNLPCHFLHAFKISFKDSNKKKWGFKSSNAILFMDNTMSR